MITDFNTSNKTKIPACCSFDCCGNRFGRIESHDHANTHGRVNRIVLTRRYAKRAGRPAIKREIEMELAELNEDKMYDWRDE